MAGISFYFHDVHKFAYRQRIIRKAIREIVEKESFILGSITVIFCSDTYLLEINRNFLNHDFFTDIVTFDSSKEKLVHGELYISIDRVKENSKKYNRSFMDELYRVIFHGILHLVGYSDKSKEEKIRMRQREDFYLDLLYKREDFNVTKL